MTLTVSTGELPVFQRLSRAGGQVGPEDIRFAGQGDIGLGMWRPSARRRRRCGCRMPGCKAGCNTAISTRG